MFARYRKSDFENIGLYFRLDLIIGDLQSAPEKETDLVNLNIEGFSLNDQCMCSHHQTMGTTLGADS